MYPLKNWWKNNRIYSFATNKSTLLKYITSLEVWECTKQEILTAGSWDESEIICYANNPEVLTAFCCLKSFFKLKKGLNVMLKLDKTTALAYVNKQRGQLPMHRTIWWRKFGNGIKTEIFGFLFMWTRS